MGMSDPTAGNDEPRGNMADRLPASDRCSAARDQRLETLRGMALLFVLAHHAESGSWVGEHVSVTVRCVMMPLFAAISGYLAGMKPLGLSRLPRFIQGKVLRIGIPMACCVGLMLALLYAWPEVLGFLYPAGPPKNLEDMVRFFLVHPQTFWFLQSILVMLLAVGVLDALGFFDRIWRGVMTLVLSSACLISPLELTGWLSLDGVQFLLPYFLLGFCLKRYDWVKKGTRYRWAVLALGSCFMLVIQLNFFFDYGLDFGQGTVLGVIGCLLLTSALFFWGQVIPLLARLGGPSFGIYLFHRLGWLLGMLVIPFSPSWHGLDLVAHVLLMIAVGWGVTALLQKSSLTRMLFLGEKRLTHGASPGQSV